MDAKTVPVKISDEIKAVMEDRGIREEDIREVLEYAETTGKKLYVDGEEHFLAKKKIGNFTAIYRERRRSRGTKSVQLCYYPRGTGQ